MRFVYRILAFLLLANLISCSDSQNKDHFNFDFETVRNNKFVGWVNFSGFKSVTSIDSTIVKSGKYSMFIDNSLDNEDYQICVFPIMDVYNGKEIILSGYIKTENVSPSGFAGLYMSLEPQIAEKVMRTEKVHGTIDWTEYKISMKYIPSKASMILIGGILVGEGKMWLDNLKVTIDGKAITTLTPIKINKEKFEKPEAGIYNPGEFNSIFESIDQPTIINLELLARIWGFLKYNHPKIANGICDWDKELLDFIPSYIAVKDIVERDKMLQEWINQYGDISRNDPLNNTSSNAFLKPDLNWIDEFEISSSLKDELKIIYNNRLQGSHSYVKISQWGILDFSDDISYENLPYNDMRSRILALFRYWNIINYFYPYKYLSKIDWNDILGKYIPLFLSSDSSQEYEKTFLSLFGELSDTHINVAGVPKGIEEARGIYFAPIQLQYIQNKFVVVGLDREYKGNSKISYGDIVTHIDGMNIENIVDSVKMYYPSSNENVRMRDIADDLLRSNNHQIELDYLSDNIKCKDIITLYNKTQLKIKKLYNKYDNINPCFTIIDNNIGYIDLSNIHSNDIGEIKQQLKNTSGIIIDIRKYPSDFVVYSLGSYFIKDLTSFAKLTIANINNPGEFYWGKDNVIKNARETYQGKVVVLINEQTQSSGEFTAMAMKAGMNAVLMGGRSAGADGDIAIISLPGEIRTAISTTGVYYPNGEETQGIGLTPDYLVEPTIEGIKNNRDEVLEEAIKIIHKGS